MEQETVISGVAPDVDIASDDAASKTYEGFRPYIFVSYSSEEKPTVERVIRKLTESKYRIWYDEGIKVGRNYAAELHDHVSRSNTLLVFLSDRSIKSKHVINEVGIAFDNDQIIVPVWISEVRKLPSELEYWLRHTQQSSSLLNMENGFDAMIENLKNSLPDITRDVSVVEGDVYVYSEDTIRDATFGPDITTIADEAFKNRTKLRDLKITENIKVIGNEAFRNCKSLKEVTIPKFVKQIGTSAFRDCINLESVVIARRDKNPIEIGERCFENCTNLTSVELPDNIAEIYGGVFNSCRSLEEIYLPNSITVIGDNAFGSCDSLRSIDLPDSITKIDDSAFYGCSKLKEVVIPDNVSKIGKNVFKDCHALERITLSKNLTKIASGSFRGCTVLKEICIDKKNKFYRVSDNVLFNKSKSELINFPPNSDKEEYEIPDSVTKIGDWAFCDNVNIRKIEIPDCVTTIGECAFFKCTALESLVLPDSIEVIEDNAFRGCSNLKEIVIESSVIKDLGWGIFYGCSEDLVVKCVSEKMAKYCTDRTTKAELITI